MIDGILRTRHELNNFATSCYGIVLSIMQLDFVCNYKVFNQVGQLLPFPLIVTIHQRQLLILGHILRKPDKKKPIVCPLWSQTKSFFHHPKDKEGHRTPGTVQVSHSCDRRQFYGRLSSRRQVGGSPLQESALEKALDSQGTSSFA